MSRRRNWKPGPRGTREDVPVESARSHRRSVREKMKRALHFRRVQEQEEREEALAYGLARPL